MAFKTNYRQERAQKARTREAKKEEKLRKREEASAKRKALREEAASPEFAGETPTDNEGAEPQDK
jgi:hypothetical protein